MTTMQDAPETTTPLHGSYDPSDVVFLLKPITAEYTDVAEKEKAIQSGTRHYSEMISIEKVPDGRYMELYEQAMEMNAKRLSRDVSAIAHALALRPTSDAGLALVSLARAGTPIGVLIHRALGILGVKSTHHSISIIRDRGLDLNAMRHVLQTHDPKDVVFVDGWTGKGAIRGELDCERGSRAVGVQPYLVVVADPAGCADLAASGDDYVIPSGILNGIVSGLVSRTILNESIGPDDFHGTVVFDHMAEHDVSRDFVDRITVLLKDALVDWPEPASWTDEDRRPLQAACRETLAAIAAESGVTNPNNVKPGIAEATRAVLRRVPDKLYLKDVEDPSVAHLVHIAKAKGVEIDEMPVDTHYRAATVIRSASAE
jgi:hypothetical protein